MEITTQMHYAIKDIFDKHVNEGVSGRLFCTNYGLKKIAEIIGKDYQIMGKRKRKEFRNDVISGFQMGFFKQYGEY